MTPHELRQRRTACHLTQTELGRRADIAQPHICTMEAGDRTIGPETAERLEAALTEAEREQAARAESIARCVDRTMERPHLRRMADRERAKAEAQRARQLAGRAR